MKTSILRKGTSLFMALVMCLSAFIGIGSTTAFAAGEEAEAVLISFPRDGDANYSAGDWGHDHLNYMNGWSAGETRFNTVYAMGSYYGNICYCIEPGTALDTGDRFTQKDENYWDNYPSAYNHTIAADDIKLLIGRILQYGYTGTITSEWRSQTDADTMANAFATQILVWETVVGERDADFNHVSTGSYDAVLDTISATHPLRSKIMSYYNSIVSSVQKHSKVPSFCSKSSGKAQVTELTWDGSQYTATLTDSNNVLGNYSFSSDYAGLKFTVNGNKLTVTTATAPGSTVTITAAKNNSQRKGLIVWSDGNYAPGVGDQDTVSYVQSVSDPVKGYVNIKVSYGSAKIVKTSEDGKVDGVKFRVEGNGVNQTVTTKNGGQIQIDNLTPGVYTVTELAEDKYEPQESRKVTVVAGQTATVTFNNKLKRGDLSVIKTAEDDFVEGVKFHLYGTAFCGLPVDEYAVTDASGVAAFEDVLIGSGYTLEEVDTAIRYVVPDDQTAAVEWKKVTQKTVDNVLKKFNVTVNKRDAETTDPQGDATLAGAVYGIYNGGDLIDTYTTDASGSFTTSYYVCGDNWSIREITPSEGYLLDETSYHVGAEAKNYTVEYNAAPAIGSPEDIIKGKIAIIKHTDDGETQIETPETGAEFEVFLKASGSYAAAKETERDILTCDENGFSETKLLPYGVYTVHQTKGWEGRELLPDFDVYIAKDGQTYRYLANNSNFESYLKIVKVDAETGNPIPYAGAGFQIYRPDGSLVTQTFTYPEITTIDTFYTTAEGFLITAEPLEYGTGYSLVEVAAPYGYVLDSDPVYFDITQDNSTEESAVTVVKVIMEDMPQKGVIKVSKTGEVFASVTESDGVYQPVYEVKGLPGAVYEITAVEDIYTPDGTLRYAAGEVVDTITTDETGSAQTKPLYLGKYEIHEITAPYGMTLNPDPVSVELTYAGQEVEITESAASFYNERQRVQLALSKVMEKDETFGIGDNGEILSVQFGLFAAEDLTAADGSVIPKDGLIEIVNCDENGSAVFRTDLPVGAKLYVKELATDSQYILSDTQYPVIFEYAGQEAATVNITANEGNPIDNDLLYGTVQGLKIDRETEKTIAGAVFGLFRSDETEFTEETAILTAESGEDGVFTFENVPFGNWQIVELKPAEGFLPNSDIHHVQVTEDGQAIEITAVNDRIPEIGTTATVDGEKEVNATEVFTLEDVVAYEHLIPGKEYVLKGVLMDKATEKPLLIDGEEIRSETTFVPETPSGEVTVSFTFDSKYIKNDTDIVVFESLYKDGLELTVHADIEDEGQTVKVHVPEIGTQATAEGKKEVEAKSEVTIEDVVSYKNLTPGKEYTVSGVLMDKATGEPFTVNGKKIRSEVTFTPETADGEVTVKFTFDATGLTTATEMVVFESLYREGVEIAVHADIEDDGQTVKLTSPTPDVPQTGDNSNLGFWIGLGAIALGGLISVGIMAIKRKKDDDDE
ncbi:MAG: SpaA isopeptide-forming pilin-related protein [Merdibacter sp.]